MMFQDLPETIPHKNRKKLRAVAAAAGIQAVLVAAIIVVQMAMPEKLGQFQLLTTLYMAPPPPPPAALMSEAPQAAHHAEKESIAESTPVVREQAPQPVTEKPEFIAPITVPKDIARISEAGPPAGVIGGVVGGVTGGTAGGINGGIPGGILGSTANVPPPPPPPAAVRVGGNVKEPRILHIEQPKYPPEARKAGVEGVVVVEATLTTTGSVEKIKVISGPPLLTGPAVEAVSNWKYEPTYLNGQPVPVILTARISFSLAGAQK